MLFALFTLLMSGLMAQNALPQDSPRPLNASVIKKLEVPSRVSLERVKNAPELR
jgi:hypothetical protein